MYNTTLTKTKIEKVGNCLLYSPYDVVRWDACLEQRSVGVAQLSLRAIVLIMISIMFVSNAKRRTYGSNLLQVTLDVLTKVV